MMNCLYLIIGAIIGIALGIIFSSFQECYGVLKIDMSGDKDLYRFEIDDLDVLSKKRRIIIKIDNKAEIREKNT